MLIHLLGDSNLRNTLEINKERLVTATSEEFIFKMATSNESIKAYLEAMEDDPKIVFIMTPLNEVVKLLQKNQAKGRDETLRAVIEEMSKIVHASANVNKNTLHVLIPPFLRLEPSWYSTRVRLGVFYVKDHLKSTSPWNIITASITDIMAEDLSDDRIQLNTQGKEKFYKVLEGDILKCKENLANTEAGQPMEWASDIYEPPTPKTMRKRNRELQQPDSDEEDAGGKKARLDSVLDKLDSLVKEIKQERAATKQELGTITIAVEENKVAVAELKDQVVDIMSKAKGKDVLTAEMREDIDSLENDNLKQVVVVRKLKDGGSPAPREKRALRNYVQSVARALVAKILDQEAAKHVKYAATLYSFLDPTKKDNAAGLVPPFKIGFSNKDAAVRFRDEALRKAKQDNSEYKTTYFSFFQSAGTRVRAMLLWSLADVLKTQAREVWVAQNLARPMLQVKEGGRITESLTFVKAMIKYGDKVPKKTLEEATKLAKKNFSGNLRETFVVLED
jgi:hypothetical protein